MVIDVTIGEPRLRTHHYIYQRPTKHRIYSGAFIQ